MKTFFFLFISCTLLSGIQAQEVQTKNIEIIRDQWGVPHIYAPTDEEVAYGLAWATAEDDFVSMQENFLAARGRLSEIKGKNGAIMDFLSAFTDASTLVDEQYPQAFSPKFRKVLEYYCKGVNDYAAAHPDEVLLKGIFPATVKDMLVGYVLGMSLMTNVQNSLIKVIKSKADHPEIKTPKGSNAIAVSKLKTGSNETFLAINSHQPLTGPFSWYEAHLHSEEGWDILGGTFPGGATIFHGVNQHLGWAHTVTMSDLSDLYLLKMHPSEKLTYRFDGQWLKLEERTVKLKVKVGFLKIPVKRKYYMSVYGPTLKGGDEQYYSFRFPANMGIKAAEQWYHMNKAQNFDAFYDALKLQGLTGLNIIYADKEDNIFYIDNGQFPKRNPGYNWWDVLPGDTSATLWKSNDYYPLEALAQIKNPECGYIFNTNNTPFLCTGDECNFTPDQWAVSKFYFTENNNRSLRMKELMEENKTIDYETFKVIKFDNKVRDTAYTFAIANLEDIFHLDANNYPEIKQVITELSNWDRQTDTNSVGAAILAIFIQKFLEMKFNDGNIPHTETTMPLEKLIELLSATQEHLLKHFNTVQVPLGKIQRLVRGDISMPVSGIPDVIAAMSMSPYKKGTFKADAGESYIMLIRFNADGPIVETISPFGSSSVKGNKHFDDQMPLFIRQQLKPMTMDKNILLQQAEHIYHPGE
jgi:acyl-homoserine-lactone acylase